MMIFLIKDLIKKEDKIPYWVVLLQYISAVAVGLTFGGHNVVVIPVLIVIFAVTFLIGKLMLVLYKVTNKKTGTTK